MSKKANPAVIGGFVMGAVALAVAGILVFGSGKFFRETSPHVLYFEGSLKGLNVGSSVKFRGVKIGSVTDIQLCVDREKLDLKIPVFIEIDPTRFVRLDSQSERGEEFSPDDRLQIIESLIQRGLRAKLVMESFVTGQLMIELDFYPDKPLRLVNTLPGHLELPTIPTDIQEIENAIDKVIQAVRDLPLKELVESVHDTAEGINELVNSPDLKASIASLDDTLHELNTMLKGVNERGPQVASALEGTMEDAGQLIRHVDARIEPLSSNVEQTAEAARKALVRAEEVLATLRDATAENSQLRHELQSTLRELSDAARAVRVLAEALETHPEALLHGKTRSGDR